MFYLQFLTQGNSLCVGMKVQLTNSIILGTIKLWWLFPIKQKFDTTAAWLIQIAKFENVSFSVFNAQVGCTMVRKLSPKFTSFTHFYYKKAAMVSNFCLIGKIHHSFMVPRMIELVNWTFMPIQTLDLHRVRKNVIRRPPIFLFEPNRSISFFPKWT